MSFCIAGLSLPLATISNACTIGMPAPSMVASCRVKTAMSPGIGLAALGALALLADPRGGDALAAQLGAQGLSSGARLLPLMRCAALVAALPGERNVALECPDVLVAVR